MHEVKWGRTSDPPSWSKEVSRDSRRGARSPKGIAYEIYEERFGEGLRDELDALLDEFYGT
jgi:hypothetical protein